MSTAPPPRLVASDLDGTLLDPQGRVTPRTRAAVQRAVAAGAHFLPVTGRPPRWMAGIADGVGHTGLAVCANGAVLYDLATERVVRAAVIDDSVLRDVVAALRDAVPGVSFAVEGESGFAREHAYRPVWDVTQGHVDDLDALLVDPRYKVMARHTELDADQLLAAARTATGAAVTVVHSSGGGDGLVEISAAGVTKAAAVARFADEHGFGAADVVAFGDMPNDLPMLEWAGRGVAMGDAHPDVLAVADEVTASNADDGVAQVLERLFADGGTSAAA